MISRAICAFAAAMSAVSPVTVYAGCEAGSGPKTAALVELYTSEGCSSCPPAERQFRELRQSMGPSAEMVGLALHVGYWDYIGWKDPYAQNAFGDRQSWLVRANKHKVVYTPQFFVGGGESRPPIALAEKIKQINALPAAATIRVRADVVRTGTLALNADATAQSSSDPLALYVAFIESGLVSKVTRGENSGTTLTHDNVVRELIGPVPLSADKAQLRREIDLPVAWNRSKLGVAAFVQNERTGAVVQAVGASQCADDLPKPSGATRQLVQKP
jgi:hypothetical protein